MTTFRTLDEKIGLVPADVVQLLARIDEGRGREEAFRRQHPERLKTLVEIARIQSTEASNAIENVTAPRARIVALVQQKTAPANRSEQEIAGYRFVLDQIHERGEHIPLRSSVIEQFHRDLYRFTAVRAGRFKTSDNVVTETREDGAVAVRFEPVSAFETPRAMEELNSRFLAEREAGTHHALLLIGCYLLDVLVIHPFTDGNGRLARLLALLLLYQAEYEVGRFVSLERQIADAKDTYYETLAASTERWHDDAHDVMPWLRYFLGTIVAAYREFEERSAILVGRGAKTEAVKEFLRRMPATTFTFEDLRRAAPGASDALIRKVLNELKAKNAVRPLGVGRASRWERVSTDF